MPRAKGGPKTRRRHKKLIKLAKGFWGQRKNVFRRVKETVERALVYAYRDRRQRKRDFRKLWQVRINAGARQHGLNYSKFMGGLKKAGIELDRKVLAYLAMKEPETFAKLVEIAKSKWQ